MSKIISSKLLKYLKKNVRGILIIGIVLFLFYLYNSSFSNNVENFYTEWDAANLANIRVGESKIAGRGVFAKKDFKKNEIIEVCPLIEDKKENISGVLGDYLFDSKKKEHSLLPFGYCAVVNHSSKPNAVWKHEEDKMIMLCLKDIKNGEEIFHSYGEGYWNSREKNLKEK